MRVRIYGAGNWGYRCRGNSGRRSGSGTGYGDSSGGCWGNCGWGGSCGCGIFFVFMDVDDGGTFAVDDTVFRLEGIVDGSTGCSGKETGTDACGDSSDTDSGRLRLVGASWDGRDRECWSRGVVDWGSNTTVAESAIGQAAGEATSRSVVVLATGWESTVRRWWMIATGLATEAALLISAE